MPWITTIPYAEAMRPGFPLARATSPGRARPLGREGALQHFKQRDGRRDVAR